MRVRLWRLAAAIFLLLIAVVVLTIYSGPDLDEDYAIAPDPDAPLWEQRLDFARLGYSNETGHPTGQHLVPNFIHFIRFGPDRVSFVEFICILAAFSNQRPERIYFHYDDTRTFSGRYWETLLTIPGFREVLAFHRVHLPNFIFWQPLSRRWRRWHGGDITRIRVMVEYGGIYLDNDCYVIKSLDPFRRFEITMNWDEDQFLASQVIIAHRDARFLRRWLDCYRVYKRNDWYYNAGVRPTTEVLFREPELIHRVKTLFGADMNLLQTLYMQNYPGWRDMYVWHLLNRLGHQSYLDDLSKNATFPVLFNEDNVGFYPTTFREMVYDVYDKANLSWPRFRVEG